MDDSQKTIDGPPLIVNEFWLTPPKLYTKLDNEFHFDFDPCIYPKPKGYNGIISPWGKMNYVNPPFRSKDGSPTKFAKKAILEQQKGNSSFLTLPTQSYVNLLLESGAELRSLGRIKWLESTTKKPMISPSPITGFYLKGKK